MDNALSCKVWEQMRLDAEANEEDENRGLLPVQIAKRRMFFSDFVKKAISQPMDITPDVSEETYKQFYRLYLFL
jgi:hypothetical protein